MYIRFTDPELPGRMDLYPADISRALTPIATNTQFIERWSTKGHLSDGEKLEIQWAQSVDLQKRITELTMGAPVRLLFLDSMEH